MIIRSLLRRPTALRAIATPPIRRSTPPLRSIHNKPALNNEEDLVENGIPGLFSKAAFNESWTEYQKYMMDELDTCLGGTPLYHQSVQSVVIETARDPMQATPFNYASMAWNNHFFFKGISTDPDITSTPSPRLISTLNHSFSSYASFNETFLSTAEAMFGPGFVWLVQVKDSHTPETSLKILTTYLAGSPLSGAHYRRQSTDLSTHNPDSYRNDVVANGAGSFGPASAVGREQAQQPKKPLGGVDIVPLLCVNTWEHVWLRDYGVRGKVRFLEKWWSKIDWGVVESAASLPVPGENKKKSWGPKFVS